MGFGANGGFDFTKELREILRVSGSLALLYFLLGFHGGRLGSGPDKRQCPVEWRFSDRTSPPLGHPARPVAQPARPEAQLAMPEA